MASASGLYSLTLEKLLINSVNWTNGIESTSVIKGLMVTDTYTPNFDTHDFWNDIGANEVTAGSGYTSGGMLVPSPNVSVPGTTGNLKYTSSALAWTSSTITSAKALLGYRFNTDSTLSELIWSSAFGTAASSSGGTFTVTPHSNGWWYFDLVP